MSRSSINLKIFADMKKLFFFVFSSFSFCSNANAAVCYSKVAASAMPTGIIVLISIISVLLIVGIVWLLVRPIRKRRLASANRPAPIRPRMRPRMRQRRRVIIVR